MENLKTENIYIHNKERQFFTDIHCNIHVFYTSIIEKTFTYELFYNNICIGFIWKTSVIEKE